MATWPRLADFGRGRASCLAWGRCSWAAGWSELGWRQPRICGRQRCL